MLDHSPKDKMSMCENTVYTTKDISNLCMLLTWVVKISLCEQSSERFVSLSYPDALHKTTIQSDSDVKSYHEPCSLQYLFLPLHSFTLMSHKWLHLGHWISFQNSYNRLGEVNVFNPRFWEAEAGRALFQTSQGYIDILCLKTKTKHPKQFRKCLQ